MVGKPPAAATPANARQRRTTSFQLRRRRRLTNQRNGEYGCEAMHWLYE